MFLEMCLLPWNVVTYNYSTLSSKYILRSAGCMWTPTTTVRCQANTSYAARVHVDTYNYSTLSSKYTLCSAGACGHLQLQYVVKHIHLMQRGCMWTSTTAVRCQANTPYAAPGACGHLQLQYVVKQIHLMQRGVQHLDKLYIYIGNLLLTNTSACACPFNNKKLLWSIY